MHHHIFCLVDYIASWWKHFTCLFHTAGILFWSNIFMLIT
uniref:Uncharacterized protein n=1 Tax=Anguilla anguilla TaxID=7936 RepID=A0A0E9QY04_ANGAN